MSTWAFQHYLLVLCDQTACGQFLRCKAGSIVTEYISYWDGGRTGGESSCRVSAAVAIASTTEMRLFLCVHQCSRYWNPLITSANGGEGDLSVCLLTVFLNTPVDFFTKKKKKVKRNANCGLQDKFWGLHEVHGDLCGTWLQGCTSRLWQRRVHGSNPSLTVSSVYKNILLHFPNVTYSIERSMYTKLISN